MSIRHEVSVALFWRNTISDDEYIKFEPADMLRWYDAMALREPIEIEALMNERFATAGRRTPILGIVSESPHPPAWLVREWLATQVPKFRVGAVVNAYTAWLVCSLITGSFVYGCQHLAPYNIAVWKAPFNQPPMMAQAPTVPIFGKGSSMQDPTPLSIPVRPPPTARSGSASGTGGAPPSSSPTNAPP